MAQSAPPQKKMIAICIGAGIVWICTVAFAVAGARKLFRKNPRHPQ
jgi:hypothetical protein